MSVSHICPHCQTVVTVAESPQGGKIICSGCWQDFDAPDSTATDASLEIEKPPLLKASRLELLEEKLAQLTEDGELSLSDKSALLQVANQLKLTPHVLEDLQSLRGQAEARVVLDRVASTLHVTDDDLADLEAIRKKYGLDDVQFDEGFRLARQIYLIEERGELPPPYANDARIMLEPGELLYFHLGSALYQMRSYTTHYSGISASVPAGLRGLRFRAGQLTPSRTEELTQLSEGVLYVSNKRLIFSGNTRNTTIDYRRVIDFELFSDSLCVKTNKVRADYFAMAGLHAKYISALVWRLRQAA